MKNYYYILLFLSTFYACKKNPDQKTDEDELKPVVMVDELLSNQDKWWTYQYNRISLSSDFEPIDTSFNVIPKGKFLWELTSGNFVPIEMESDSLKTYKLYAIPTQSKNEISQIIKNLAKSEFQFYLMAGKPFPEFKAKDMEGDVIDQNNLIGKTTVLKTWFINCKACIKEMPELNKLVDRYENENIQFISLALDEKKDLEKFLEKTEFNYAVLPEQKDLIQEALKLNAYPTHIVVNKSGKIVKVLSKGSDLIAYVKEFMKNPDKELEVNSIPPPPPPLP
ncbi:MAG: TlpA disulfide reductase family protein [Zunongwangia sp.]|uniref:TlpA family protein disulfide reductase n=1 Tax=Zunongwangia sp. TaxID=1965325 RepID=UPI003242A7EE|tara:strand:- start:211 stop:1050 length:840 start_codon:yes stop_codon:yes gene_type:complete